jgi:hypothetical protein
MGAPPKRMLAIIPATSRVCRPSRFAGPSATAVTPTPSCVNANSAPEKSWP